MTVLMRALNLSSNFITWTSTSPDYEGAYAPEAIQSDSAIVVADTGGGTIENIGKLGLEYDPVALWLFNGNLNDSSGNGLNLSGTVFGYSDFGAILNGTELTYSTTESLLQIAGALTIECVASIAIGASIGIISMAATGESLATNCIYQWTWGVDGTPSIYWEYGAAATNVTWTGTGVGTFGYPCHMALTRTNSEPTTVTIYINGEQIGNTGSVHTAEGGSAATFRLFSANDGSSDVAKGCQASCVKILDKCLTVDEIKAEYNRTLGGRVISWPRLL
jgi:hypothetical protein